MAESSGDKTEQASQQKLRKVREQGQVVRSRDVATAIGLVLSLKLVVLLTPGWLADFRSLFGLVISPLDGDGALENLCTLIFPAVIGLLLKMLAPLAVIPLAIVLGSLWPGGWVMSGANLAPKFERLNPLSNLARMVSGKHYSDFGMSLLKACLLIAVLLHVVRTSMAQHLRLQALPLGEAVAEGAGLMLDGIFTMSMIFVLFAVLDMPLQRFLFMRQQRMSKQDQKEEHKSNEGRPEVRQRIRQLQMALSRRSARKTVPEADVVIVNPEHYAVALKYDERRAQAPYVVAKGVDEMALYIRQIAREHKVEVLELPPLARAIYNTSQVQQQIPAALYKAVALVLNHLMQLQAFHNGKRPMAPVLPTELPVPAQLADPVTTESPEPAPSR
ncbi:flagellar type III secretion system protein FlhB [Ideonella azotifigens]|uniref:Flagellar biosynthesis protein FlhB n=1 Tax=Ideonella azotifigens TaxID=513160 RepID=A0ABP3VLE1_9BURK|nr:flagellar type III secretion system protein FlhB [Ideonella azotifigens]MCD2339123.1 flagellar type III secretion system protein FlhB [Ideonella azotifigens]